MNKRWQFLTKKSKHYSWKRYDKIGVDDVDSFEEVKMRSSTDFVNDNDDFVIEFDASTCSDDNVYELF